MGQKCPEKIFLGQKMSVTRFTAEQVQFDRLISQLVELEKSGEEKLFEQGNIVHTLEQNGHKVTKIARSLNPFGVTDHKAVSRKRDYFLVVKKLRELTGCEDILPSSTVIEHLKLAQVETFVEKALEEKFNFFSKCQGYIKFHQTVFPSGKRKSETAKTRQPQVSKMAKFMQNCSVRVPTVLASPATTNVEENSTTVIPTGDSSSILHPGTPEVEENSTTVITTGDSSSILHLGTPEVEQEVSFDQKEEEEESVETGSLEQFRVDISQFCGTIRDASSSQSVQVKRTCVSGVFVPKTATQKTYLDSLLSPHFLKNRRKISSDITVTGMGGNVLFALYKKILPLEAVETLQDSVSRLGLTKPTMRKQAHRGHGQYYLFGYTARQGFVQPYTYDTNQLKLFLSLSPFFETARKVVKSDFPTQMNYYQKNASSELAANPLVPFTGVQLNFKTCVKRHVDVNDYPESLACVTTVGSYQGGELHLSAFNVDIGIEPGDMFFYQAGTLEHFVCATWDGDRSSINLFCNYKVMKWRQ